MEAGDSSSDEINNQPKSKKRKSTDEPSTTQDLQPGSCMWARMTGYPPWPARVARNDEVGPLVHNKPHSDKHVLAFFFGSKDYYWVKRDQTAPYDSKETEKKKKRTKVLELAILEANEWMDTPEKEREYPLWKGEEPVEESEEESEGEDGDRTIWSKMRQKKAPVREMTEEEKELHAKRKQWRLMIMRKLGLCAPSLDPSEWGRPEPVAQPKKKKSQKVQKATKKNGEESTISWSSRKRKNNEGVDSPVKKLKVEKASKEGKSKALKLSLEELNSKSGKKEKKAKKEKKDKKETNGKKEKKEKKEKTDKKAKLKGSTPSAEEKDKPNSGGKKVTSSKQKPEPPTKSSTQQKKEKDASIPGKSSSPKTGVQTGYETDPWESGTDPYEDL